MRCYNLFVKIVVTGKTGVGKTTLIKELNSKQILFMDSFIKENFYVKGHPVFDIVVSVFGEEVIFENKINTKKLGAIVFSSLEKLDTLSLAILPFVKRHIQELQGDWIIEMATFINYQEEFKGVFDKVILIQRDEEKITKKLFDKDGNEVKTIKNNKVYADFTIDNNDSLEEGSKKLRDVLLKLGLRIYN